MSFVTLKHQHMRDQWRSQSDLEGKQDCLNYGKVRELPLLIIKQPKQKLCGANLS